MLIASSEAYFWFNKFLRNTFKSLKNLLYVMYKQFHFWHIVPSLYGNHTFLPQDWKISRQHYAYINVTCRLSNKFILFNCYLHLNVNIFNNKTKLTNSIYVLCHWYIILFIITRVIRKLLIAIIFNDDNKNIRYF